MGRGKNEKELQQAILKRQQRTDRGARSGSLALLRDSNMEAGFMAVFGAKRSPGVIRSRPITQKDLENAYMVQFAERNVNLYYIEAEAYLDTTFVVSEGADNNITYTSNVDAWQANAAEELDKLRDAICSEKIIDDVEYGPEREAVEVGGYSIRFGSANLSEYARVVNEDGEEMAYWVSDEFAEDPDLVCGALLGWVQSPNSN